MDKFKFNVGDKVIGSATATKDDGNCRDEVGLVLTVLQIINRPSCMNFFCEEDDIGRAHQHFDKV